MAKGWGRVERAVRGSNPRPAVHAALYIVTVPGPVHTQPIRTVITGLRHRNWLLEPLSDTAAPRGAVLRPYGRTGQTTTIFQPHLVTNEWGQPYNAAACTKMPMRGVNPSSSARSDCLLTSAWHEEQNTVRTYRSWLRMTQMG